MTHAQQRRDKNEKQKKSHKNKQNFNLKNTCQNVSKFITTCQNIQCPVVFVAL